MISRPSSAVRLALGLAAAGLLAACGDDAAERDSAGDARRAAGEVQGGTISDAMLPLDSVRSQNSPQRAQDDGNGAAETASASESEAGVDQNEGEADAAGEAIADDPARGPIAATDEAEG